MSFYDQLNQFKSAMRVTETGVADDRRAYQKVTGQVGGVPLLGPYSIRSDEWEALSAEAGIPGARWQDNGAQEAVMSFKLTQLYNQFGGRWDAVALAWRAGGKAADLVVNQGYPLSKVIDGAGSEEMQLYINDVIGNVDTTDVAPEEWVDAATYEGPFANAPLVDERPRAVRDKPDAGEAVLNRLGKLRDQQIASNPMEDLPPPAEPEPEEEPTEEIT